MTSRSLLSNDWRKRPDAPTSRNETTEPTTENVRYQTPSVIRGDCDPSTLQAVEEGRRLYVGNLPYMAKTEDVEKLFARSGYHIVHINMSIDPFSGRNPSYCFAELSSKEQAEQAIRELNGQNVLGRPTKLGLGVARSQRNKSGGRTGNRSSQNKPVFQRWTETETDASTHFKGYSDQERRVWVGGLPEMETHGAVNQGILELFQGFPIEAVSKVVIPKTPGFGDPKARNHRYLFVDFPNAQDAKAAVKATNGRYAWGVQVRVRISRAPDSRKPLERDEWEAEHSTPKPAPSS